MLNLYNCYQNGETRNHVKRVLFLCEEFIARGVSVDANLLLEAAILHDIAKADHKKEHSKKNVLEKVLPSKGVDPKNVIILCDIIANHNGTFAPLCFSFEATILRLCDKLDKFNKGQEDANRKCIKSANKIEKHFEKSPPVDHDSLEKILIIYQEMFDAYSIGGKRIKTLKEEFSYLVEDEDLWKYYAMKGNTTLSVEDVFSKNGANDFICKYFIDGGKQGIWNSVSDAVSDIRKIHTVSVFLLGILIKNKLNIATKPEDVIAEYDEYRNFLYFWFLTCLYHDVGYCIEDNSEKYLLEYCSMQKFIVKREIKYNLLDVVSDEERQTVDKYYIYRAKEKKKIDHGLVGAVLLYDSLMKIYDVAKGAKNADGTESFDHNELRFSADYPVFCKKVATGIMFHNIWKPSDDRVETLYKDYGLDSLCGDSYKKISSSTATLESYLLSIADTIEPTKRTEAWGEVPDVILQNTLLSFNSREKQMTIQFNNDKATTHYTFIADLEKWVDVGVTFHENQNLITLQLRE